MSSDANHELAQFKQFLAETLAVSPTPPSPEEALDIWRAAHPAEADFDDSVAAVRQSLDDLDDGERGISHDDFDRGFRSRHGLPPRS